MTTTPHMTGWEQMKPFASTHYADGSIGGTYTDMTAAVCDVPKNGFVVHHVGCVDGHVIFDIPKGRV